MKKRRTSPEELCWYYAVGCLDSRHIEGTLSQDLYEIALKYLRERIIPPPEFVQEVFPRPFATLGDRQTLEAMQEYWRVTHMSPEENTPVHRAEVIDLHPVDPRQSGSWYLVSYTDSKTERAVEATVHNTHGLPLRIGDRVYVHGHTIAEIDAS